MSNQEQKELEKLGYRFEVLEQPVTGRKSTAESYHRVVIRLGDEVLGTRSELRRERALERAYKFAREHHQGEDPRSLMV